MIRAPFVVPCWPPFSEVVLERRALDLPPTRPLTHSRTGPTMAWEDCRKAYLPYIPGWNEWKWSQNGGKAKGAEGPPWQQHACIVGLTRVLPHWGMTAMISQEKKDNDSAVVVTERKEKPPHSTLCGLEHVLDRVSGWLLWCHRLSPFIGSVKTNVLPCLMGPASYGIVQSNPNQGRMAK